MAARVFRERLAPWACFGVAAGMCLLPLELPITQAAHGVLARHIGDPYILFHPLTLIVVSLTVAWWTGRENPCWRLEDRLVISLILLCAAFTAGSSLLKHSDMNLTFRYLYFGFGSIVLAFVLFRSTRWQRIAFRVIPWGVLAWLILLLTSYALFFVTTEVYSSRLPERILALRAPGDSLSRTALFFDVAGNVNKVSNYALVLMVLLHLANIRGFISKHLYWVTQALLIVVLIITFSRGAFSVLFLLALGFCIAAALRFRRDLGAAASYLSLATLLFLPPLASVSDGFFREYWANLETVTSRVDQAASLGEQGGDTIVFGYGVGNYGEVVFGDPVKGTHNLFLDTWANGGFVAVAAMAALFAVGILFGLRGVAVRWSDERLVGVAGLLAITALGLREYDIAYLYATSIGGFFVGAFVALALHGETREA
ncbi:hypothetical protein JP75_20870 [Devosia riboflavina]|uniref:O-antigen ligase-related domain-containing protein n=1 Tax=Devosia riboflavina TaxID=46914 RepID=A0A087LXQ8_9HYPH|nr:O-antigen ligase family protein [Devosia riboflavina]KFL29411.1 hypothetical protein JP75_20870 [Devosia riboflavina]